MPGEEKEGWWEGERPDGQGWHRAKESWYKGKGLFCFVLFFLKCVKRETGDERETQALERERGGCK